MELSAIVCNFRVGSAPAITYPLNKWLRVGKSNKRKEEKMDTSIDKPIKRPVPKPITGQFPKRGASGQFLPGASGNPQGRPLGSRNRASLLMEDLLDGRAKALTEKAIEKALAGGVFALRLCLDRMMPVRRQRSLTLRLAAPATAQDIAGGFASMVEALAHGELTPTKTSALAELSESARRALETTDLARRAASVSMVFRSAAGAGIAFVAFLQKGNAKDRGTPSGGRRQGLTVL
jgi:hypothetical protein